jgi:hypothetical protein
MNLTRRLALPGFATVTLALGLVMASCARAADEPPREYLQRTYGLKLTVQTANLPSGALRLGAVTNTGQVDDYLRGLIVECKKYPAGFFSLAGVSEIVLCGDLHMGYVPIDGNFNHQQKRLYVKFHWCQYGAQCRKSFHAFHHELGHALQTAAWGDGHYDWREWAAVNPPQFHYGNGGSQELMANPEKNWAVWATNQPGFLNAYSTTAPWEDRSEIMAALMNDGDRAHLSAYCHRDAILRRKIELMSRLLSSFCGTSQSSYFWERAAASLNNPAKSSLNGQALGEVIGKLTRESNRDNW